ncbi:MAG: hypothetical protein IKO41_02300 [Lachnospiraceae bacterium]|nr:hypothetical protein [Lachnospiraceae bacterium]
MSNKARKMEKDHEFYCTICGNKGIPVCRTGRVRETGHLKKLYCLFCNRETNHAECISGTGYDSEMFQKEKEAGNFNSEGTRILPFLEWRHMTFHEVEEVEEEDSLEEWLALFAGDSNKKVFQNL